MATGYSWQLRPQILIFLYLNQVKKDLSIAISLITSLLEELRDGGEVSPCLSKVNVIHGVNMSRVRPPASQCRGTGGSAQWKRVVGSLQQEAPGRQRVDVGRVHGRGVEPFLGGGVTEKHEPLLVL